MTEKKNERRRVYSALYGFFKAIQVVFFPLICVGRETVPDGGAIICANHTSYLDPILLALALTKKHHLFFMAKKELFSIPVIGYLMRKIGAFPVNRRINDVSAIRTAMSVLKDGEKLTVFPEGTRVAENDAVAAKAGAIRLASKRKVPLVPVHIPRKKILFRRMRITVGEPYFVDDSHSDSNVLAEELMQKIRGLAEA